MTPQEKAKLLEGMKESAKVFCEDEGISIPVIKFEVLDKNSNGAYSRDPYDLIVVDISKDNDYVRTFFHELIHHWQHAEIPDKWYDRNYSWFGRNIFRSFTIDEYLRSDRELEARSFARSIVEDLDQS